MPTNRHDFAIPAATTTLVVSHNLNDPSPFWVLYDSNGEAFFPTSTVANNANTLTFTLSPLGSAGVGVIVSIRDITNTTNADSFTSVTQVTQFFNNSHIPTISGKELDIALTIAGVTSSMQGYLGRQIIQIQHVDERYNGDGQTSLLLKHYPVTVTGSLAPVLRQDGSAIDANEYAVDPETGVLQLKYSRFPRSRWNNLGVDYQSGYPEVPQDLQYAATKQVAYEWGLRGDREDIRLTSSTVIGVFADVYRTDNWAQGVSEVMDRYRRRA